MSDERVISVDEALKRLLARLAPLPDHELPIVDAVGSVIAEDIYADEDIPAFSHSSVDGYAVRHDDLAGVPTRLRVVASIAAGAHSERSVERGEAIRIMTGAAVPAGADTVVPIEQTDNGSDVVSVAAAPPRGASIRVAGEEARRGDLVLPHGLVATPACIGLLAAVGHATVRVVSRPRVAVISTGNELVDLEAVPEVGQTRAANGYSLAAALRAVGAQRLPLRIVPDDVTAIREAIESVVDADAVILTGGTARGDYDLVRAALTSVGTVHTWSVASRPGRIVFGEIARADGVVPIFALPGNPVGALLTFEVFVRPALLRLRGVSDVTRSRTQARATNAFAKPEAIRLFTSGTYDVTRGTVAIRDRGSRHMLTSLALTNCLVEIPESVTEVRAGDIVNIVRLDVPDVLDALDRTTK